jgi:hypothetical protein
LPFTKAIKAENLQRCR